MLRSMTGYGSAEGEVCGRKFFVDFKAVNHRYFNFFAKLPQNLSMFESNIQSLAKNHLSRGQISVFASWDKAGGNNTRTNINIEAARTVFESLTGLKEQLGVGGEVELSHLMNFPEIFQPKEITLEADELWEEIRPIFEAALSDLDKSRRREGEDLESDLRARLVTYAALVGKVEERRADIVAEQKARFEKKLADLMPHGIAEETVAERVGVEIAVFAERADVTEEIVRLRSHLDKFTELLGEDGAVGRKIDFIIQEMNRENNTIGSKSPDADAANVVVELKAELEKIREQVQNVE